MPGTPALEKVLTALKAVFTGESATTASDRPEDDAFGKGELPARNIIDRGTSYSLIETSVELHIARVDIDHVVAVTAAATNGAKLREMEARTVELLFANRTLGGLVQDIRWSDSGGDDEVRADDGARALSIEILFLTPLGDHRTVIGASGLIP
jgi:hypothetical protein